MQKIDERQLFYLILILGAGFFLHMANNIPTSMGVSGDPGPGFVPFWISLAIIVLLGYLLVMETLLKRDAEDVIKLSRHECITLVTTLMLIVSYLFLLSFLGFLVSTLLFLFLFRQVVDVFVREARPTVKSLMASAFFAICASSMIFIIFSVVFELSLP